MNVLVSSTLVKYIREFPEYETAEILGNEKYACKGNVLY